MNRVRSAAAALRRNKAGAAAVEFALLAPVLLMLIFAIIIYSLYFATYLGVRQATMEGARTAMMGMSTAERQTLATTQVTTVLAAYGSLLGSNATPTITTSVPATGLFEVTVTVNLSASPIFGYMTLLPKPNPTITYQVIVANGSY
jgi:Flp pilus assembly protein TadG